MKTAELTGPLLDYWVARADDQLNPHIVGEECLFTRGGEDGPTVRWDVGFFASLILRREFPGIHPLDHQAMEKYMRQFVQRRLGSTVPDEVAS
jgi:hypothetical protein